MISSRSCFALFIGFHVVSPLHLATLWARAGGGDSPSGCRQRWKGCPFRHGGLQKKEEEEEEEEEEKEEEEEEEEDRSKNHFSCFIFLLKYQAKQLNEMNVCFSSSSSSPVQDGGGDGRPPPHLPDSPTSTITKAETATTGTETGTPTATAAKGDQHPQGQARNVIK